MYKSSRSNHPKQRELDERPGYQVLLLGLFGLVMGGAMLMSWLLVFPKMLVPLWELMAQKPLVNVHFQGFFMGIAVLMGSAALLYYRRPLIPEEMKSFWKWTLYVTGIGGFATIFVLGFILVVTAYSLAYSGGYSRCAELSNASQWNSYWALDQRYCTISE